MFVADASVVLEWMLPGPVSDDAARAFALAQRSPIVVPALWLWETQNVVLSYVRRKILTPERAAEIRIELGLLSKRVDMDIGEQVIARTWTIATSQMATFYDASYIELAARLGLRIATTDRGIRHAAAGMHIALV